ncbi:MAG: T9SS type A sorting domain-containing protein [Prevotellaceae bacterium]|jgi:hypothetical protein|nr:T9SS type A sorting domain-containing protein [Prevotellaceae bacterium]
MKKMTFVLAVISAMLFTNANAQIVKWDFSSCPCGPGNFGASSYAPSSSDLNLTVGDLTRHWTTGDGNGAGSGWGGNNFTTATTFAAAVDASQFVTFTLTANSGYALSLDSIGAHNIRRSTTGTTTGQWQYAVGDGDFTNIGAEITWGATVSAGNPQGEIDLSSISALQDVAAGTTVTVRLVVWGATAPGGTFYFNDRTDAGQLGLKVYGSVARALQVNATETLPVAIYVADGRLQIANAHAGNVEIFNAIGAKVKSAIVENGSVNISDLAKGIYIVRLGNQSERFVIR